MFGLKKKFPPISEYPDTWELKRGTDKGAPMILRKRSGLAKAAGHPGYPFQVGVAVPLNDPDEYGFPGKEEMAELEEIENRLCSALSREGLVLSVVLTTSKMREFVFYAPTWRPQDLEAVVKSVEKDVGPHQLQFIMQHDPGWDIYKAF